MTGETQRRDEFMTLGRLGLTPRMFTFAVGVSAVLFIVVVTVLAMTLKAEPCSTFNFTGPALLVVGGRGAAEPFLDDVEVVALDAKDEPSSRCVNVKMKSFQHRVTGGSFLVCGGRNNDGHPFNECFDFNTDHNRWNRTSGLMNNSRYDQAWVYDRYLGGLVMAGGIEDAKSSGSPMNSVEWTRDGITFELLGQMQGPKAGQCLAVVDDDNWFMAGGYTNVTTHKEVQAFVYSKSKRRWSRVSDMTTERRGLSCGVVAAGGREGLGLTREVVVAGGYERKRGIWSNKVEIYSFETGRWRRARYRLPQPISDAAMVSYGDTFLLVGGLTDDNEVLDTVYRYIPDREDWTLLPTRLASPKSKVAAVIVANASIFAHKP